MSFLSVAEPIAILFVMIVVGFIVGKTHILSEKASGDLTKVLMNVAVPASVISSMNREFDQNLLNDGLTCFVVGFIFFAAVPFLCLLLAKLFKVNKKHIGSWAVAAAYSNTGFMGYPIAMALFGADGVFLTSMIVMSFNILVYTLGAKVTLRDSTNAKKLPMGKLLITPINISIVIGLIIFIAQIPLPEFVSTITDDFGALLTPIAMFTIGLNIEKGKLKDAFTDKDCYTAGLLRLVVFPIIMLLIMKLLPAREGSIVAGVCVLILSMPSPSATFMIAEQYSCDTAFASRVVFVTTLASLVTIPIVMMFI